MIDDNCIFDFFNHWLMDPETALTFTHDHFKQVFFAVWMKQKLIPQLTQNLCVNIRFHLYIHDHVLDEPIGTLTSRVKTYVPPI